MSPSNPPPPPPPPPTPPPPPPEPDPSDREPGPPPVLREIILKKREEVARLRESMTFAELEAAVAQVEPPRNFFRAVTRTAAAGRTAVIAEVKRKSPSAGLIRPEYEDAGFSPEDIAEKYYRAGASAISCLTDGPFFGGDLSFIQRIKDRVPLPVLRKDFIIDPWQLWESRAAGADAVLLIAECLTEGELLDLLILSQRLGLTTLLEAHDMDDVLKKLRPHQGFPHPAYQLIGINNRDLRTMKVDLNHTLRLAPLVEDRTTLVSESGIRTRADLRRLREAGVRIVLVGEHLMRQDDPGEALAEMLREDGEAA